MRLPARSLARPLLAVGASATLTFCVTGSNARMRDCGAGVNANSLTYSLPSIHTGPSTFVRVLPLSLNASFGGMPSTRVTLTAEGTGAGNGPAGQRAVGGLDMPPAAAAAPAE